MIEVSNIPAFRSALKAVSAFTSGVDGDTRYAFNGVCIKSNGTQLELEATDGRKLVQAKLVECRHNRIEKLILSQLAIKWIEKLSCPALDYCKHNSILRFRSDSIELIKRTEGQCYEVVESVSNAFLYIDGTWPQFDSVMPAMELDVSKEGSGSAASYMSFEVMAGFAKFAKLVADSFDKKQKDARIMRMQVSTLKKPMRIDLAGNYGTLYVVVLMPCHNTQSAFVHDNQRAADLELDKQHASCGNCQFPVLELPAGLEVKKIPAVA